jgi:hypothetical protein
VRKGHDGLWRPGKLTRLQVVGLTVAAVGLSIVAGRFDAQLSESATAPGTARAAAEVDPELIELLEAARIGVGFPDPPPEPIMRRIRAIDPDRILDALTAWKPESWTSQWYFNDDRYELVATYLRDLDDPAVERRLVDILASRPLNSFVRGTAAIALSRDGTPGAGAMRRILADWRDSSHVREAILKRASRWAMPAPPEFEDLVYLPFHAMDYDAAALLTIDGRDDLVVFLVEGLDDIGRDRVVSEERLHLAATALVAAGDRAGQSIEPARAVVRSLEEGSNAERADVEKLATSARAWLGALPPPPNTAFRRERAAYMSGPQRAREMRTLEALDCGVEQLPEDFDFAAAALWLERGRDGAAIRLEWLARLSRLVDRELARSGRSADAVRRTFQRLVGNDVRHGFIGIGGLASGVGEVLRCQSGNCVGLSSLVVAVGDRIGLEFEVREAPRHVYVTYVSGGVRTNFETQDGFGTQDDAQYGSSLRHPDHVPDDVPGLPRAISKRELLATLAMNFAVERHRFEADAPRMELGRAAVALGPRLPQVLVNFALLQANAAAPAQEVLASVERAEALRPLCYSECFSAAQALERVGLKDNARVRAARARRLCPGLEPIEELFARLHEP